LYGALAVKGYFGVSPGQTRGVDRSPAIHRGRVRRSAGAFPPASSFRGFAVGCPARCGILPADRPKRLLQRTIVSAVGDASGRCCGRPGALLAQRGTVPGLALGWAHRNGADTRSGHATLLLSIVTVTFPRMDPRGARHWARKIAPTHLYSVDLWDPDHDAVIRIGGRAPRRQAHSLKTACKPCLPRVTAASDRHQRLADPGGGRRISWDSSDVNRPLTAPDAG
jgi:hypothetical protein